MPNPDAVYSALISAVVQAPPPAGGGTEDALAAVADRAKHDSPDLSAFRFPHQLPVNVGAAGLVRSSTLAEQLQLVVNDVPGSFRRYIALSVVDLSGSKAAPRYAAFQDELNFDSASVAKICGVLAAYQFQADVNAFLARHSSLGSISELAAALEKYFVSLGLARPYPRVELLFDFHPGVRPSVSLQSELLRRLVKISKDNENGSTPIVLLNYPYLASVMLAYGLFDTTRRNGFWLQEDFYPIHYPTAGGAELGLPRWKESPYQLRPGHSVSSLAAARYFTLAAQGKLVDPATSQKILSNLAPDGERGCGLTNIDTTALVSTGTVAAKCGYYDSHGGRSLIALHYKSNDAAREAVICVFTIGDAQAHMFALFDGVVKRVLRLV